MSLLRTLTMLLLLVLAAPSAYAACSNPTGDEGKIIYNSDYKIPQYCNGTQWVAWGSGWTENWTKSGSNLYYTGGNVGIGTASPQSALHVSASAVDIGGTGISSIDLGRHRVGNQYAHIDLIGDDTYADYGLRILRDTFGANSVNWIQTRGTGGLVLFNQEAAPIVLSTQTIERMRIDASGNVGIGTSSPEGFLELESANTGIYKLLIDDTRTDGFSSSGEIGFKRGGVIVGGVTTSTGGTQYNTTSDKRLKKNITPTKRGIEQISQIKVVDFDFIKHSNDTRPQGFIAQDLYRVYPEAVSVGGDDVEKHPWSVDYGRLTPLLVKSIQEQQGQIRALKAENDALEARLKALEAAR